MENEVMMWEGLQVHGDVTELDRIVATPGIVALDKQDLVHVLEKEGESYIGTGIADTIGAAFEAAISSLDCPKESVTDVVVSLQYGELQFLMVELSGLSTYLEAFDNDVNIIWGSTPDCSLGRVLKVVLLVNSRI